MQAVRLYPGGKVGAAIALAVLVLAGAATSAEAAVYYVSKTSPAASDNNPGTAALPFMTMGNAAATVRPGDTVIVKPGMYLERINFYAGNLSNATVPTTFKASSAGVFCYGFDTYAAPHLRIEGFEIHSPLSLINSNWTAKYGVFVRSSGVRAIGNTIRDISGVGIQAYWVHPWPDDVIVENNLVLRCNQGIVIHGTNWTVQHNEVRRLIAYDLDCDYIRFFGRNILIRKNYLHGTYLSEVGISHVDGFQTFPNNGWYAENVRIESNFVQSFHQGAMLGVIDHANYSGWFRNLQFTNNVFHGGDIGGSWGIQAVDVQGISILHNLFIDIRYAGVLLREYSRGQVQNNIFVNAGQNYYKDAGTVMHGGYNILNRTPGAPNFRHERDLLIDPQLRNARNLLGKDNKPWTTDDGYLLRVTSPGRDKAAHKSLKRDVIGRPRPLGAGPDIGPYELPAH